MIMGQKRRIAPPTAHDHEKPNDWRRKLSTGEANVRRVEQESPAVGGKRPQAAQAAGRKRQAGAHHRRVLHKTLFYRVSM
jgi:hypothetical protein